MYARYALLLALGLIIGVASPGWAAVLRPPAELLVPPPMPDQPPLTIPVDNAQVVGPAQNSFQIAEGEVRVSTPPGPTVLFIPFQVQASDYNVLRLRMRHTAGQMGAYLFSDAPIIPQPGMPLQPIQLQADGQWHTAAVSLTVGETPNWAGEVHGVTLVFPEPAEIAVGALELARVPVKGPVSMRLGTTTEKVLARSPAEWAVTVPAGAVFEASVGTAPGQPQGRFTCTAVAQDGREVVLVDQSIGEGGAAPGQWTPVSADLSALAGTACTLRFAAEGKGYWGAPLIRTPRAADHATPIILISNDTLRADHLSCYGYGRDTTPNYDAFAKEAVLFTNAVSEEPGTLQAHMTMLTGLHPSVHGLTMRPEGHETAQTLDERFTTLAEVLAGRGYVNAGFVGVGHILIAQRGFARGFDQYSAPDTFRDILETRALIDPWLEQHADAPFFLFFHN